MSQMLQSPGRAAGNKIFADAREEFLASLSSLSSEQQAFFSPCASGQQLLEHIKSLDCISKKNRLAERRFSPIKRFIEVLQSYFSAIDVLVQCDPIHAATVWGALRLVFQLLSNLTTFFDKFTATLDQLVQIFPVYDRIAGLCDVRSDAVLRGSLQNLYVDLLGFFQCIIRIFFRDNGQTRKTHVLFGSILWKPYDARFGDFKKNIESHREILVFALTLHHIKISKQAAAEEQLHFEELELKRVIQDDRAGRMQIVTEETKAVLDLQQRDLAFQRLQQWIDAPDFDRQYERSQGLREEGTAQWLFDHPTYERWRALRSQELAVSVNSTTKSFERNTLWAYGNAGCGKTVQAASTIEELRNTNQNLGAQRSAVCYFFFESDVPTSRTSTVAYRAFLSQMLQAHRHEEDILDRYTYAMNILSHGQPTATHTELFELLTFCYQTIDRVEIVLDAIDECIDPDTFVQQLLELTQISSVKLILFCRPTVSPLCRSVPRQLRISLRNESAVLDIRLYLRRKLEDLADLDYLPECDLENLVERLVRGADGMFLWARLMVSYLSSPALTLWQRLDDIAEINLPEGLDAMYSRIINLILSNRQASKDLAKRVITWLLYARRELAPRELEEALIIGTGRHLKDGDRYNNFADTVLLTCAGLVERETDRGWNADPDDRPFRFIHLSVKEYLGSLVNNDGIDSRTAKPSRLAYDLVPLEEQAHLEMATSCLQCLNFRLPAQPLSGRIGKSVGQKDFQRSFPFGSYASTFWISHMTRSIAANEKATSQRRQLGDGYDHLIVALSSFFAQRLAVTSWVEACYVLKNPPSAEELQRWGTVVRMMERQKDTAPMNISEISQEAIELAQYLTSLQRLWGSKLIESPGCIWDEVTAFTPCRFLQQSTTTDVQSLIPDSSPGATSSIKEIKKISQLTADAAHVTALSIWPSRNFEDIYQRKNSEASFTKLRNYSSGWTGRYEIYSVVDSKCVVDLKISLDADEIWYQILHSLWKKAGNWVIQFPLSISPDGQSFTILRTLYALDIDRSASTISYSSSLLPVEAHRSMQTMWSETRGEIGPSPHQRSLKPDNMETLLDRWSFHGLYTYWVFFSPDGCHICIIDQTCFAPNSIAIFSRDSEDVPATKLILQERQWLRKFDPQDAECLRAFWDDKKAFNLCFHSQHPLLAINTRNCVILCKFEAGRHAFREIAYYKDREISTGLLSFGIYQNSWTLPKPKEISFSTCGNYVVAGTGSSDPAVIPLPPWAFSSKTSSTVMTHTGRRECRNPAEALGFSVPANESSRSTLSDLGRRKAFSCQQEILTTKHDAFYSNGQRSGLRLSCTDNSIGLHQDQAQNSGNVPKSLLLTHLPNWAGLDNVDVSVKNSSDLEDRIQIVLNKTAKPWSELSEPADRYLPAIVTRDKRLIQERSLASGQHRYNAKILDVD